MHVSKRVWMLDTKSVAASDAQSIAVLRCGDIDGPSLHTLLLRFGLVLTQIDANVAIPGSYWGDSEAGLIGHVLYCRADTPLQSILHEASHYICMDALRRANLNTDAGGDYDEENAVCYLQIVLSDYLDDFGRDRMLADMDAWGYTFRLGSARAWFEQEAQDAKLWLQHKGVLDVMANVTWTCRQ